MTHTNAAFANERFSYDANGNQMGMGYTTGAGNEQTASLEYTYTYDVNGEVITFSQMYQCNMLTYINTFCNQLASAVE